MVTRMARALGWTPAAIAGAVLAQPEPAPPVSAPTPGQPAPTTVRFEDLPPAMRLGVRVEAVRRGLTVLPVVVIVPDGDSYIEAIAGWTVRLRYPVLIDDGTPAALEDIARFVRGFAPLRVVRWTAPNAGVPPRSDAERRARVEGAVVRAWRDPAGAGPEPAPAPTDMLGTWKSYRLTPMGVVAANELDTAWTGALALAAGRAQPIAWVRARSGVHAEFAPAEVDALAEAIEAACRATGLAWEGLGDSLDAVTLALNTPHRVRVREREQLATTDVIGRVPAPPGSSADEAGRRRAGGRWAWTGQVFGTEPQAAYRAMCALFLMPSRAWVFDGYPDSQPWLVYDGEAAGGTLTRAGLRVVVDDAPSNGPARWRSRAARPLDADLVLINSKGNSDFFALEGGQCAPGDVPLLAVPGVVHLVHSWSAAWPLERATVAGRWLEHGAYAYYGSVQEPMLAAFVPTPTLAARMVSNFPLGAAVRVDDGPAWKLALFGDPLITLGPPAPRAPLEGEGASPLPLPGARNVEDELREALEREEFAGALAALSLLGRDSDAARLVRALLQERPAAVTPEVAAGAVLPVFRAGDGAGAPDTATLVALYSALPVDAASAPLLRDALWLAAGPGLRTLDDERLIGLLRTNLRADQPGRDAAAIARAVLGVQGREPAMTMLAAARAASKSGPDIEAADEAMRRIEGRLP